MDKKKRTRAAALSLAGIAALGAAGVRSNVGKIDNDRNISYVREFDDSDKKEDTQTTSSSDVFGTTTTYTSLEGTNETTTTAYTSSEGFGTTAPAYTDTTNSSQVYTTTVPLTSNVTTFTTSSDVSTTDTSVEETIDVDYDNYLLMHDTIGFVLEFYISEGYSLSDDLVSNYGVSLTAEQKARYDTIMRDTYDAYKKGVAAYESGDMETFRSVCDDVLNKKKYLNLDDLVDIVSFNINRQGDYIKDSGNYSISDGKLIIDGYTVEGLLSSYDSVSSPDVMSLIEFYDGADKDTRRVLNIMQIPKFVIRESQEPSNMTLVNNNEVYTYNNDALKKKFDDIDNSIVDIESEAAGQFHYCLNMYYNSFNSKVGYFDGKSMKSVLDQYANGNKNVKVVDFDKTIGMYEYDCYMLMQDTGRVFERFNSKYSSLSEALVSTYGVSLTAEQKARYDTIMQDTYNAYKKGEEAYKNGNVSVFREICDDILNKKKYLNLDDLVDILAININTEEHVIDNSKNYSFSKGELVIDGAHVERMFKTDSYSPFDVMWLFDAYEGVTDDGLRPLSIMQVPKYVVSESLSPSSFSLMVNGTLYEYRNEDLNKRFDDINAYFVEKIGLTNFGYDKTENGVVFYGYDDNSQKQYISNDSEYIRDLSKYVMSFYPAYQKSKDGRVGYFDGPMMAEYLDDFDKTMGMYAYDCYMLMQDTGRVFERFNSKYSSLSEALVSTYGVSLTAEQKARYDTIMQDTYNAYKKGEEAYKNGNVSVFREICDDILNKKKYLNLDDLVDILAININTEEHVIDNSKNYSFSKGELVIDGAHVERMFKTDSYSPFDVMWLFDAYEGVTDDGLRPLSIMQVPKYVVSESLSPSSFSLMVNGTLYEYRNEDLNKRFDDINAYFVEKIGLTNFGYDKTENGVVFYGYDDNSQKQYISNDSEYIRDLSKYVMSFYPAYQKSKDGRVGYFDGPMMAEYLIDFDSNLKKGVIK